MRIDRKHREPDSIAGKGETDPYLRPGQPIVQITSAMGPFCRAKTYSTLAQTSDFEGIGTDGSHRHRLSLPLFVMD